MYMCTHIYYKAGHPHFDWHLPIQSQLKIFAQTALKMK